MNPLCDRTVLLAFLGLIGPLLLSVNAEDGFTDKGHSFAHIVIDSNEVQLGEPFEVVLLVEAAEGVVRADFSALVDFNTRFVSSKPGLSARGVRYELHYAFIARRSGKLELPAIEVSVGKETLKTEKVDLRVLEPVLLRDLDAVVAVEHPALLVYLDRHEDAPLHDVLL